jgi:hypothetical protein
MLILPEFASAPGTGMKKAWMKVENAPGRCFAISHYGRAAASISGATQEAEVRRNRLSRAVIPC